MSSFSRKRFFTDCFLTNNIDNTTIVIHFNTGIAYTSFFVLTKLIHSSILKFQINPFSTNSCRSAIFLLSVKDPFSATIAEISTDYKEFKAFLTSIKADAINRYKALIDNHNIIRLNETLEFIVDLGTSDIRFKHSSLNQCKSLFKRKRTLSLLRYDKNTLPFSTTNELIQYYYTKLSLKWLSEIYYPVFPIIEMEDPKKPECDETMEIPIFSEVEMEFLTSLS